MAASFNLNNNEISKELLVNKFNMIFNNQGITSPFNEPQRSPEFVQKQPVSYSVKKGVLNCFASFICVGVSLQKLVIY